MQRESNKTVNSRKSNQKVDKAELEKFIAENPDATQKSLANIFDCSEGYISIVTKRHGIPYQSKQKKDRKIDRNELRRLVSENPDAKLDDLAKAFDCTRGAISIALRKHEIPYRSKEKDGHKIDPDKLRRLVEEKPHATLKVLAKHFNCIEGSVAAMAKRHQIPYQPKVQNKQKVVPKKLRRLINDNPNITIRELAVFFGCNRSTIYRSLKRHNISYQNKRQRPPNVDPKKLENLIKKHPIATMKELAKFIGCHESAVGRTLKRHNIYYQHKPSRNKKINIELLRKFAEENSEIDIKELATHFGCTEPSIFSALKRHGIVYKLKQRPKYELRSHANQNTFRSQERHSRKIDVGELRKRINENPQAKLAELAEPFGCSHQAISKVIKTHKIPYKTKYGIYPRKRCRGESRALPS